MKILKYQSFMIKEELLNTAVPAVSKEVVIKQIQDEIDKLKQLEGQFGTMDQEDFDEMIESFEEQPIPETVKKYLINSLKVIYDEEIRDEYLNLLTTLNNKLRSGLALEDIKEDEEFKKLANNLQNNMAVKLNLNREELDAITGKFMSGAQKFNQSKLDAAKTSTEDPYGEEEWDNMTDEERMKIAFEEE